MHLFCILHFAFCILHFQHYQFPKIFRIRRRNGQDPVTFQHGLFFIVFQCPGQVTDIPFFDGVFRLFPDPLPYQVFDVMGPQYDLGL